MKLATFLALLSPLMAAWAWATKPTPYGLHEVPECGRTLSKPKDIKLWHS